MNVLYPIPGNSKSLKSSLFIYLVFFKTVWYSNHAKKKIFTNSIHRKVCKLKKEYFVNLKKKKLKRLLKITNLFYFFFYNYVYKIYLYVFYFNKNTSFKIKLLDTILRRYNKIGRYQRLFRIYRKTNLKYKKKIRKLYSISTYV
jgi:hypothetical protein